MRMANQKKKTAPVSWHTQHGHHPIPVNHQGTANPTWGDIFESCFKTQSSKLESLFSLKRGKRDLRALSFSTIKSIKTFENVTPSGIIMIFIFTILLIQTYIQTNYYYDKKHANSTVITQYVEIALNNRSTALFVVLLFFTGLEWVSIVVLYFS